MAHHDSLMSLHCGTCYEPFDLAHRRPVDLGCGHAFCDHCLLSAPNSFTCVAIIDKLPALLCLQICLHSLPRLHAPCVHVPYAQSLTVPCACAHMQALS